MITPISFPELPLVELPPLGLSFQRVVQAMLEEQLAEPVGPDQEELAPSMGELTDFHRDVLSGSGMTSAPESESDEFNEQGQDDDLTPG